MNVNDMKESKYIAQKDVRNPTAVTVAGDVKLEDVVGKGNPEDMRYIIRFAELSKPLVLNQTNAQLISALTGKEDTSDWNGAKFELYVDPTIMFGGKVVGGVRVRPLSGAPTENPAPTTGFDDPIPGFD